MPTPEKKQPFERVRRLLLLGNQGYQVETAESLNEGLELTQNHDFDLFLLDYQLNDSNGKELCKLIREFDSSTLILFFSRQATRRYKRTQ